MKGKKEKSRNNRFTDAILGLLIFTIKMFLLKNKLQAMNNNINSQIQCHSLFSNTRAKAGGKTFFRPFQKNLVILN
jgi:hypothetical protein